MINSILRLLIQVFFNVLSIVIQIEQALLRKNILSVWQKIPRPQHGPEDFDAQRIRLEKYYASLEGKKWWVLTSGTSKEPKKIPYDEKRIKHLNKIFLKSMVTLTSDFNGPKTFFAFGSLEKDQSLTSSMIDENDYPSHVELLQAPYRFLATSRGKELKSVYGDLTARTAVLIVTKPRFLYATNPSTLTHFLDELKRHWPDIRIKLKQIISDEIQLPVLLKMQDGNGLLRLKYFSEAKEFFIPELFPSLQAVITWDGGYVKTFLDRLMRLLPARIRHIPMYSMSTETIETLPHRINGRIVFLPTMKNTLPEFLDQNGKIHMATDLELRASYTLVITNKWGMERYDTQDEFKVDEIVEGLPSLKFMRRRNITASITGEKVTENQAILMQKMLKDKYPELAGTSLSLFPVVHLNSAGYQMVIIGEFLSDAKNIAIDAEKILGEINNEYRDKVRSGRLLPIHSMNMSVKELAALMGQENRWESQFKVMPLYEKPVAKNN